MELVAIELTQPLPSTAVVGTIYKIEGTIKMLEVVGAPPWVYAQVRFKEWWKPEIVEEVSYERGFPIPVTGSFSIDFKPEKEGDYQVTVLATPAPLSLPVVGVFPITGKSDMMEVSVGERPPAVFRFSKVTIDGNEVLLTNHDADSGLLLEKTTADYLDITPAFEWTGSAKTVTISIKAGHKDWLGGFSPKTEAYTRSITLPESPDAPYSGELETPIRIPLTACGGLIDGAIEVVLKIADEPDYISQIWNVYATKPPPEKYDFDLVKPTPSNANPEPGTPIDITCPVTSRCAEAVDARAKVIIYEGSILPGHGDKIGEYDSDVFHIEPDESKNVIIHHTTVEGTIDRRDVEVEIYIGPDLIKESEWDDVYYVGRPPEEEIDFDLTKPTVTPAEITPGTSITITCPVTSACTEQQTVTAKVKIYEGSIMPGHGTLLDTKTSPAFTISPGQTYNVKVSRTAVAGTIARRDVEVEIYIAGKLVKESEWDDVYYVKVIELELLEIKIDPTGAGTVTTNPAPSEGTQHNWYFPHGTTVYVTAHPKSGYTFKSWSGEMTDTPAITAPVYPMTEKRTITAHFESEAVPPTSDIRNLDFRTTPGTYDLGDSRPFDAPYEYKGKAQGGYLTISLGTGVYPSFFTRHTFPRTRVSFNEAMDWTSGRLTGSFTLPTTLEAGQTYNIRAKLETDDGKQETDTDWGIITIREVPTPPKADIRNFDFRATGGTYNIGDKVPFTAPYEYKGKAQSGRLTISLGTGVYPSFFTKHTFSPISVSFNEAMDWRGGVIDGRFTLPTTLEPGQTYSVRAKLEAISDYTQETDTDWGVLTITKVVVEPKVEVTFLKVS